MSKYKTTWHDIAKAILRKEEFITEEQLIEQDKQDIQEFSRSQLDALARQYSDLKGKTISIDNANKLRKIFDKIPNHFLNDLRKKHIPFLSGLALSRMVQKGIPVKEDREIAEGFEWHTLSFLKRKGFNVARFSYGKLLVPKSDVEDVKKLLKKETEKVNGDVTVMPNAIIGEAKEEVLDEGLQLSKLVGKSIAHLEMYVELANDIKKEYFKTNSQVSMFIKAKADQVLRSVPSLVKDLRKPGIWSEQLELNEISPDMRKFELEKQYKMILKDMPASERNTEAGKIKAMDLARVTATRAPGMTMKDLKILQKNKGTLKLEEVSEADLSKSQVKQVHKQADELPKKDFIKRYGKDGDAVRYATATNQVKNKLGLGEDKVKKEETMLEFTTQQIKQAYGILNDPRYKQGNYSGAVKAIEKLAKGLSKHKDVANALKRANESVIVDPKAKKETKKENNIHNKKSFEKLRNETKLVRLGDKGKTATGQKAAVIDLEPRAIPV